MISPAHILLVEDDRSFAAQLRRLFEAEGHSCELGEDLDTGLTLAKNKVFDLIVTDLHLPVRLHPPGQKRRFNESAGIELIECIRAAKPHLPIILMTAYPTMSVAIRATKLGVYDYWVKEYAHDSINELLRSCHKAIAAGRVMSQRVTLGESVAERDALVGNSHAMLSVYKQIGRIADKPVPVLIQGEPGTGKELVARAVYQHSNRAAQPFLVVDCLGMPDRLLERDLFGGADSGTCRIEQANRGTLFLKEIGQLSLQIQTRLLKLLKERVIEQVSESKSRKDIDVRLIASTHCDLDQAVRRRKFLPDLRKSLEVAIIRTPTLKERKPDIPHLANYFLEGHATELGMQNPGITADGLMVLENHFWTGNVRELEKVLHGTLLRTGQFPVTADQVRHEIGFTTQLPNISADPSSSPNVEVLALKQRSRVDEFRRKHRLALLTLVFTDIVGSTRLKQQLGDHQALRLILRHHSLIRGMLAHFHEAEEISTAGDSFFIVFARPSDAVRFAILLQSRLRELNSEQAQPVLDRVGIHVGEVFVEEKESRVKDLYGMQVDICARVMSVAEGGQILLTRSAYDNARQVLKGESIAGVGPLEWQVHGAYTLKGVEEPLDICEVGEIGFASLRQPGDSEKVHRCSSV